MINDAKVVETANGLFSVTNKDNNELLIQITLVNVAPAFLRVTKDEASEIAAVLTTMSIDQSQVSNI